MSSFIAYASTSKKIKSLWNWNTCENKFLLQNLALLITFYCIQFFIFLIFFFGIKLDAFGRMCGGMNVKSKGDQTHTLHIFIEWAMHFWQLPNKVLSAIDRPTDHHMPLKCPTYGTLASRLPPIHFALKFHITKAYEL